MASNQRFDFVISGAGLVGCLVASQLSSLGLKCCLIEKNKIKDKKADIETNKEVMISEFLSPMIFPKKPDVIEANNGRNNNAISILSFQTIYFFNSNC